MEFINETGTLLSQKVVSKNWIVDDTKIISES
jgi:hypothetical protein